MPIYRGKDEAGYFYRWGKHGKKYYFDPHNPSSAKEAKNKAGRQARAAYAHGWREH
jgi:hypothetical protein